jgi:hypothetical protein
VRGGGVGGARVVHVAGGVEERLDRGLVSSSWSILFDLFSIFFKFFSATNIFVPVFVQNDFLNYVCFFSNFFLNM